MPSALITRAAAMKAVADEEEAPGPMPAEMRKAFLADPERAIRAAIRATKHNIAMRIMALPREKPPALANATPTVHLDAVGGNECKATSETSQPSGPRTYYKPHEFL